MHCRIHWLKSVFILAFLTSGTPFLSAQKLKLPDLEAYGGYSYIRYDGQTLGFAGNSNLYGWTAAITAPHLYDELGLTLKASGDYGTPLSEYNFLAGPQYSYEKGPGRIFGEALFGKAETKVTVASTRGEISSEGLAVAVGGGLQIKLLHHLSVRAIDADYVFAKSFGGRQDYARISAGIVYEFGRK